MHAPQQSFRTAIALVFLAWLTASGCTAVNTFPMAARPGDTISVMVGGSEQARKDTISAVLTDATGGEYDLQALGLVRSVFNLRADGRAHGMHYSDYLEMYISWEFGHEPIQTVLVADLPQTLSPGNATLSVSLNVSDNSSGISDPTNIRLEVLEGLGASDGFRRKTSGGGSVTANLQALEPAPHAKLSFASNTTIGAASLIINVDHNAVNLDDLNVYVPEATVRGSFSNTGAFGDKQRMVYWRHDGDKLYIDIVAPQGIQSRFLQLFIIHPRGLLQSPNFTILEAKVYDVQGAALTLQPQLAYFAQ